MLLGINIGPKAQSAETFNLTKWGKEIVDEEIFKNIFKEKYYIEPLQNTQPVSSSDDEDIDI